MYVPGKCTMNIQRTLRYSLQCIPKVSFSTFYSHLNVRNIPSGAIGSMFLYGNMPEKVIVARNQHIKFQHLRLVSTFGVRVLKKEDSILKKLLKKLPFLRISRTKLKATGYFLYEAIADNLDYVSIFEKYDLPDTFYSWFVITELHIWMLSVRCMAEGDEGRFLRNSIIEALWNDVAQRVKKLGAGSMRPQLLELSEQLQASLIAYDEGLQSDDVVLAGALWRRLYQMEDVDIHDLEALVKYVRKQISDLDSLPSDKLFKAEVRWK